MQLRLGFMLKSINILELSLPYFRPLVELIKDKRKCESIDLRELLHLESDNIVNVVITVEQRSKVSILIQCSEYTS